MALERDLDRGISNPYVIVNIYDTEGEEVIAHFVENTQIPLPDEGEQLHLEASQFTEEGETDAYSLGVYVVEEKTFKYSLARPPNLESEEADRLFAIAQLNVTPK